jgi:regulator of protease activity HflC (stomatin/prohibitin superfamily)
MLLFVLSPVVFAQNAGQQASQIAIQQAQQAQQIANQQAIRAAQQANDDALRANQQAMDNALAASRTAASQRGNAPSARVTRTPRFSPKPGTFKGVSPMVTITDRTKGATIYFTTDGSMPTLTSARYTGPITLSATATLKAMAVAPSSAQSPTAQGMYIVK